MPYTKLSAQGFSSRRTRMHVCVEMSVRHIPFECENGVTVHYRGRPVALHRLDLVIRGGVLVELKAAKMLKRVYEAQVLAYLKASRLPVGLLMNFGAPTLKEDLDGSFCEGRFPVK